MVIISEMSENASAVKETASRSIQNGPEICSFGMENKLDDVLARDSSGITAEMGAIVSYVPRISEGEHSKTGLHDFLSRTLKTEMQRYVSELKYATALEAAAKIPKDVINVAPLSSFKIPDDYQNDEQMYSLAAQKKRVPTACLGEREFSFTFPRQFVSDDKQVDDLIVNEMGRQFTFSERLEGWKIERRQRINGRFDLYYYHLLSQTTCRSTVEVLNFLLHEDKRKSSGKEKVDETDADSAQKLKVAVKRKSCSSSEAESSRKMKQKIEDSHVDTDVEKFCRESLENLSSIPNPSRVYKSESELQMSAEERREVVEKFLKDAYYNMQKSTYMSKRVEELTSEEDVEEHDFHVNLRREEKEEQPKNENAERVAEIDEDSDDETVSEIMVEDEGIKKEDPVPVEKEMAIAGEENSQATDAFAEIDEAFMEIENNPIKGSFMMSGSSSYFPPYSFEDYDLLFPPQNHDFMDPQSFLPPFRRNDDEL